MAGEKKKKKIVKEAKKESVIDKLKFMQKEKPILKVGSKKPLEEEKPWNTSVDGTEVPHFFKMIQQISK